MAHFTKCFLAGLVAILPIGGLALILYKLDTALDPLFKSIAFDFPGRGILFVIILIYLLGLTVTTFVGKWLWSILDRSLSRLPGLAMFYNTLKQLLGYGSGKDALFQRVVFVKDEALGSLELGLVTEEVQVEGQSARLAVFMPGSPNPAFGRMLLVEPARCIASQIPVDAALKALISTGKTGLQAPSGY
jgi:uncharacterized membrane protein